VPVVEVRVSQDSLTLQVRQEQVEMVLLQASLGSEHFTRAVVAEVL
jgi:hypothetical protein